MKKEVLELGG